MPDPELILEEMIFGPRKDRGLGDNAVLIMQVNEWKAMCLAAEAERDRLREQVAELEATEAALIEGFDAVVAERDILQALNALVKPHG